MERSVVNDNINLYFITYLVCLLDFVGGKSMITVTEKQWFEIGDGFKSITPLTKLRQVAQQAIVKDGTMKMLTEGIDFIVSDKEAE